MLKALLQRLIPPAAGRFESTDAAAREADRLISEGRREEDAGNVREACKRYGDAVSLAPHYPAAHLNLGVGLEAAGDTDGALRCYEAVLALEPDNPFANYNIGKLWFTRNQFQDAERHLRAALERKPDFPQASLVLANVLGAAGDVAGAVGLFEKAVQLSPDDFGAWFGYGTALLKLERDAEAETVLQRAASLDPENADVRAALASLCEARGDFSATAQHLEAALKQRPDWPDGLFSYAHALTRLHRFDDAGAALLRLAALEPEGKRAHQARLDVLHRGGRVAEALELYRTRRASAADPGACDSSELFSLNFVDGVSPRELFELHRAFGERLEKTLAPRFASVEADRDAGRRLRIGYVAGEFYLHPTARFLIPLLERHDRFEVEVYCYSVGVIADSVTRLVEANADVWREVKGLSDHELADLVNRDRIDILIDLSGHSGLSRLGMFAQQPAPVQATWLGYPNTTGLTRIQYRITDRYCDPPGLTEALYTETLARLPGSQWCYRPFVNVEVARAAPLEREGTVTFGSFTQFAKLTPSTRSLWARILRETPGSRLVIAGVPEGRIREELVEAFAGERVESSRIRCLPFMSPRDYLTAFGGVDIVLDTFPYGGGTTTFDALWMAVPVLTLPGVRSASRHAASILTTMGLTDWIAASPEDYVRRAVQFASDRETIARLRRSLRDRMAASPLMDETRVTRDLEQLYRTLWRRWCVGQPAGQSG